MDLGNIPSGLSGYHFCICIKNSYGSKNKGNKTRETFNTHFYHIDQEAIRAAKTVHIFSEKYILVSLH